MIVKNKIKICMKAVVVIAIALAFVVPTSAVVTNPLNIKPYQTLKNHAEQAALHESLPVVGTRGTDVLISSDNPDLTDETPKATMSSDGTIVVTYEKEVDALTRLIPIVFSKDNGQTWTKQFEFNSVDLSGSGYLQTPDIKYSVAASQFFGHAIDPLAEQYNEEYYWIPGDIENATSAEMYGISGQGATDYTEGAITNVGEWAVGFSLETNYGVIKDPGLGYFWWDGTNSPVQPKDVNANWAAGFYYDGQSILRTAEASQPEMATGNHLYVVMQSFNGVYSNISLKATVTDLDSSSPTFLFTSGGGPGGMDKYADIEAWPVKQFYVAVNATDPEIGAKGDVVSVVYDQSGDVKCSTSIDGGINWTITSTVATGAAYPSAYVAANNIYCAYVKEGNLFYVVSSDNGATWGTPIQINDQSGTVVAQPGTVDIGPAGFVWTDNRNDGKKDIYYEYMELEPAVQVPKLTIAPVTGGIGVSTTIDNSGEASATNVQWTMSVTGGILGKINVQKTGTIPTLAVGGSETIKSGLILGLGSITVAVSATCDEGVAASQSATGKVLLFFVKI